MECAPGKATGGRGGTRLYSAGALACRCLCRTLRARTHLRARFAQTRARARRLGLVVDLPYLHGIHHALRHARRLRAARAVFSRALTWPIAAQIAAALVVADVAGYLSHRVRHCRGLWELHAIHHASTKLDWAAAPRMHPLDDVIDNVFVGVVLLACGFDPRCSQR